MPIDISERKDAVRRNRSRKLNLNEIHAVIGRTDTNEVQNTRLAGRVWVSVYASQGLLSFRSAFTPDIPIPLEPNTPVKLEYDSRGRLKIKGFDTDTQLATGVDPVTTSIQQSSGSTGQSDFETLRVTASDTPDMFVWVKAWKPFVAGTMYVFQGDSQDMTSFVPATGLMCYAMIALKDDYTTLEVVTSTPRSIADIDLNVEDEQECVALLSANSTPIWAIKLVGDQTVITQSDIDIDGQDERQAINNVTSMAPVYPKRATMWHDESIPTVGGAFTVGHDAVQNYGFYCYQSHATTGDEFTNSFEIAAGTYTLHALYAGDGSSCADVDILVDATTVILALNLVSAALNSVATASVTLTSGGVHVLSGICNASGYAQFTKFWLTPAAD